MSSHPAQNLLVFTDLDATLLDHETYDWRPAQPALDELRRRGIPVIFNSSKTKAEQLALRAEIGNEHPFIVENGAAVYFPRDYFGPQPDGVEADGELQLKRFGASRTAILALLAELRAEGYAFEGLCRLDTASGWPKSPACRWSAPRPLSSAAVRSRCCGPATRHR